MKHNVKKNYFELNRTMLLKMNWKSIKTSFLKLLSIYMVF